MQDRPRLRRSAYWGKWSLVLTTRHRVGLAGRQSAGMTVEIDLEPVNGWRSGDRDYVEKVRNLNLRVHCTAPDARDQVAHEPPAPLLATMMAEFGPDLTAWLLDPATEILGLVNWAKHARLTNGGATLRESAWGHLAHLIPPSRPSAMARDVVEHFDLAA